jgi:hypothetical protein
MKNLFVLITVSIFLTSCATTLSRMTPQVGETWRAKCYEKENPMDFEITSVRMGFTTYKDSSASYKIPTYTFQREFVRICLAGSNVILMRRHNKGKDDNLPRGIYSEERSVTSR